MLKEHPMLTKCDAEGVPRLIQRFVLMGPARLAYVKLFTGQWVCVPYEALPHVTYEYAEAHIRDYYQQITRPWEEIHARIRHRD